MKILFVVPTLKAGGLERVASILSSYWVTLNNIEVQLVVLDSSPSFYELHRKVNLIQPERKYSGRNKFVKAIKLWFWLKGIVKGHSPDVILSFGEGYNSFVIAALSHMRIPIVVANRTTPLTSLKGSRGLLNPIFYKRAKAVVVQTEKSVDLLRDRYKGCDFCVIPNPVRLINSSVDYSKKIILNIGSIGGKKNQRELISIFAGLDKKYTEWKLIFAGDGPMKRDLEKFVSQLNISDRVIFLGTVSNLDNLYNNSSIFAFTSLLEGFPNALAESMKAGLAVISYDCLTGPSELIRNSDNGYLVEIGDVKGFRDHLIMLMDNFELRKELGQRAKDSMSKYSIEQISEMYLHIFRSIMK